MKIIFIMVAFCRMGFGIIYRNGRISSDGFCCGKCQSASCGRSAPSFNTDPVVFWSYLYLCFLNWLIRLNLYLYFVFVVVAFCQKRMGFVVASASLPVVEEVHPVLILIRSLLLNWT